jgi:hypothetical protein
MTKIEILKAVIALRADHAEELICLQQTATIELAAEIFESKPHTAGAKTRLAAAKRLLKYNAKHDTRYDGILKDLSGRQCLTEGHLLLSMVKGEEFPLYEFEEKINIPPTTVSKLLEGAFTSLHELPKAIKVHITKQALSYYKALCKDYLKINGQYFSRDLLQTAVNIIGNFDMHLYKVDARTPQAITNNICTGIISPFIRESSIAEELYTDYNLEGIETK